MVESEVLPKGHLITPANVKARVMKLFQRADLDEKGIFAITTTTHEFNNRSRTVDKAVIMNGIPVAEYKRLISPSAENGEYTEQSDYILENTELITDSSHLNNCISLRYLEGKHGKGPSFSNLYVSGYHPGKSLSPDDLPEEVQKSIAAAFELEL